MSVARPPTETERPAPDPIGQLAIEGFEATIFYLMAVQDWRPGAATMLAGFAPSLAINHGIIRHLASMPADLFEWASEYRTGLLPRRICGGASIHFFPQSPRAIMSEPLPPDTPFTILLLGRGQGTDHYNKWLDSCPIRPTIVCDSGGDLTFAELTPKRLQNRFLQVCDELAAFFPAEAVQEARDLITSWRVPAQRRSLGYELGGHATIAPNILALGAAGFKSPVTHRFNKLNEGLGPYVDQIVLTTDSLLKVRANSAPSMAEPSFPRRPSVNLFAPAMYRDIGNFKAPSSAAKDEQARFRIALNLLSRQEGYGFQTTTDAQMAAMTGRKPDAMPEDGGAIEPHPLLVMRQLELGVTTSIAELMAVSEIGAFVRPPNSVNRTSGAVRQFANHYRANSQNARKSLAGFRSVQARLAAAVPQKLLELVKAAGPDIRVIADAHMEWLDIDGLPLCIRKNLSRIPVTPGNLFVEQMGAKRIVRLTPENAKQVLILSALSTEDKLRGIFEIAFSVFGEQWGDQIELVYREVGSRNDLISALNEFSGPIAVFDGHGSHGPDGPAVLHLKNEDCDVWTLQGELKRVPPIIILSACDTHAADRNHATTANGFLALGVRAVLASVFPLEAVNAAAFAARLIYRVSTYVPSAVNVMGRALTWTEICSGMIRMQLLSDLRSELVRKKMISDKESMKVGEMGNRAINMGEHDDPFAAIVEFVVSLGVPEAGVWRELQTAASRSSAISYLNIGRPETILFDTPRRLQKGRAEAGV